MNWLCKIKHDWVIGGCTSIMYPLARKCTRCGKCQHFKAYIGWVTFTETEEA